VTIARLSFIRLSRLCVASFEIPGLASEQGLPRFATACDHTRQWQRELVEEPQVPQGNREMLNGRVGL